MKVLALNSGSSSLKFKLFLMPKKEVLASGLIEKIGESYSILHLKNSKDDLRVELKLKSHKEALKALEEYLLKSGSLKSFKELKAIGHRVVHGGDKFCSPTLIDDSVIEAIRELIPLAPLHNSANLLGIEAMREILPDTPQVAIFDTAFHQSIPEKAFRYAINNSWYQDFKIRRYGFHGTSCDYILNRALEFKGVEAKDFNCIILHLGNGASATAIKMGKSVDNSMGFTPLEGLVMGSRSGDIDPSIIFYLNKEANLDNESINRYLNRESGLKGLSGTNDLREIEERIKRGDSEAKIAFDIFIYRILKYIGAYCVILEKVDAIIFSGGIGENSSLVRETIAKGLKIFNIEIDEKLNSLSSKEARVISKASSKIELLVIPTDEESLIAKRAYEIAISRKL